ncbi:MAG TPA: 16S rRNA (cytosine(967)-C(5))-methyltransferase RsmB [Xanthomonadales bacterium]|nr:16S rRNA (cytosine(967)-C(5))-methyltransferase RsmB [Xanthomonadales bacterium]
MKVALASNPRDRAIAALADVLDHGLTLAESPSLQDSAKGRDLSMARHLAYGVLRWLTALDWLATQLLARPIKPRDRDVQRLVLLGLYQLWQDQTPPHAAIHETAECARRLDKPWAVGLVNAVLRRFQREREVLLGRLSEQEQQHAHPLWMLHRIQHDWPEHWPGIVQSNNQQAPLWLRLNCNGPPRDSVIRRLEDQGFVVHGHPAVADAVRIAPAAPVTALAGFLMGHFSLQDPAAQLAAGLLDAQSGMRVLDACAAPGGKTCHLLERTPGLDVTALDVNSHRLDLVRQNLERLKLACTLLAADAAEPQSWWDGVPFQRILLDAPCSATGVIRRHPEIKHLRQAGQVDEAVRLQQKLLHRLWPLLDVGGILVYATCSVFADENSHQINGFLNGHANAGEPEREIDWGRRQSAGWQILPGDQDMDGFYYAVLRKTS